MELIKHFLYLAQDNYILSAFIGFIAAFSESFFPALPLTAIAALEAAIIGFIPGFLVSWIGSCTGTTLVFFLICKLMNTKLLQRIKPKKIDELVKKVEKSEFKFLFLFYAIPFLPSSLITITSGFCRIRYKDFVPPMVFGKFLMLFFASYIGSDFEKLIHQPVKIVVAVVITIAAYMFGNRMKRDMELHEGEAKEKYDEVKKKINKRNLK